MATKMVRVTATGTAISGACRVHGIHYATTTTTGRVTMADTGATGTALIDFDAAPVASSEHVHIEGNGIVFETGVLVSTLSNITAASIVYSDLS